MTIASITPDFYKPYRRRTDGRVAGVWRYHRKADRVVLIDQSNYSDIIETVAGFWANWIHSDLYDPDHN